MSWRAGGDGKGIQIPAEVWERVFGPKPPPLERDATTCPGCDLHTGPQPLRIHPD